MLPCESDELCLIRRSFEGEELLLIVNPSASPAQLDPARYAPGFETLAASLCTDPEQAVTREPEGPLLLLPARSIAVFTH